MTQAIKKLPFFLGILALVLLAGCKAKEIQYGAQGCYKPDKGEGMVKYSDKTLELYQKYCLSDSAGMLLNRAIKGEQNAFISMLLYFTPMDFKATMLKEGHSLVDEQIFGTKKGVYYGFLTKKEDMNLYRIVFTEPDFDHLIIIDYLDPDVERLRLLYNDVQKIKAKINCGKAD